MSLTAQINHGEGGRGIVRQSEQFDEQNSRTAVQRSQELETTGV